MPSQLVASLLASFSPEGERPLHFRAALLVLNVVDDETIGGEYGRAGGELRAGGLGLVVVGAFARGGAAEEEGGDCGEERTGKEEGRKRAIRAKTD